MYQPDWLARRISIAALWHPRREKRVEAADDLMYFFKADAERYRDRIRTVLVEALNDSDGDTQLYAAAVLTGRHGDLAVAHRATLIKLYLTVLNTGSEAQQSHAIEGLGDLRVCEVVPTLLELLDRENQKRVGDRSRFSTIATALGKIGGDSAAAALTAAFASECRACRSMVGGTRLVLRELAYALAFALGPEAEPIILREMSENPSRLLDSLPALATIGTEASVPLLFSMLHTDAAYDAMGTMERLLPRCIHRVANHALKDLATVQDQTKYFGADQFPETYETVSFQPLRSLAHAEMMRRSAKTRSPTADGMAT